MKNFANGVKFNLEMKFVVSRKMEHTMILKNVFFVSDTQLQFFAVYVSEQSGDFSDDNLCASSTQVGPLSTRNPGHYTMIQCPTTMHGRYITLRKLLSAPGDRYLMLCDTKIFTNKTGIFLSSSDDILSK